MPIETSDDLFDDPLGGGAPLDSNKRTCSTRKIRSYQSPRPPLNRNPQARKPVSSQMTMSQYMMTSLRPSSPPRRRRRRGCPPRHHLRSRGHRLRSRGHHLRSRGHHLSLRRRNRQVQCPCLGAWTPLLLLVKLKPRKVWSLIDTCAHSLTH